MAIQKKTPAEIFTYLTSMIQAARFPSRVFQPIMQNINALGQNDSADLPTVNDDFNAGYRELKSFWCHVPTGNLFLLIDDTPGAAVWRLVSSSEKRYRAVISQSGTSAPTARVDINTLGEVPTFGYIGVGQSKILCSVFEVDKTSVTIGAGPSTSLDNFVQGYFGGAGIVNINNWSVANGLENDYSEVTVDIIVKP